MHNLFVGLIRRTACARAQFSGCSSTTNTHSETGQMAVCCKNLPLGALSSRSVFSLLVGALFKEFGLFLRTCVFIYVLNSAKLHLMPLFLGLSRTSLLCRELKFDSGYQVLSYTIALLVQICVA